jgi:hypothetical protein
MKRSASSILFAVLLGLLTGPAAAGDGKDGYLTKDGQLKATLTVTNVQGGFAGFTGTRLKVEPDGKWTLARVFQKKDKTLKSGKFNEGQLKQLAAVLAKYDLDGLKDEGKASVNPHVVTVEFGKHKATLTLGTGKPLPAPSTTSVAGRFSGIDKLRKDLMMKPGESK